MELDKTVNKMMGSLKVEDFIPQKYLPYLRTVFQQIYVAGYEEGRYEINQHTNKPIGQFRNGILINAFKSRVDAAKHTGFTEDGIKKSMYRGTPMKQGWVWRYLTEEETPEEFKKPVPKKERLAALT